jgi:hypothetical protein
MCFRAACSNESSHTKNAAPGDTDRNRRDTSGQAAPHQLDGIKTLILSVALTATIFAALLKVELTGSLMVLPLVALTYNAP